MPAGAIAGAGVLGAGANFFGAQSAADAQVEAAREASKTQLDMYNKTRSDLAPFRDLGAYAGGQLRNKLTALTNPIEMDQAALEKTPGYQFSLSQGLKAAQSSAAARGLGLSGAALKGATSYATGLANQTYQDQFNLENINRTNAYNRLLGTATLGANAGAQTGTAGVYTGRGVADSITGAGNARGAAAIAGGNAFGSGFSTLGQYGNKLLNAGGYWGGNDPNFGAGWRDDQWV